MGSCHCASKARKYYKDVRHKINSESKKNKKPPKPDEIKIEEGVNNHEGNNKIFKFP